MACFLDFTLGPVFEPKCSFPSLNSCIIFCILSFFAIFLSVQFVKQLVALLLRHLVVLAQVPPLAILAQYVALQPRRSRDYFFCCRQQYLPFILSLK